jgi:hypothetical protein
MNVRRFALRLAVGLLCFALGWASALLPGASDGRGRISATRRGHTEFFVPHVGAPPPRFDVAPDGPLWCNQRVRARHAHEWRDVPRAEEFELRFEVPPPPPRRPER